MTTRADGPVDLPLRAGSTPRTTTQIPHSQLDQQPDDNRWLAWIVDAAATWPRVLRAESKISVEGATALIIEGVDDGPSEAFLVGGEFAHGHARGDHSLHAALPRALATAAEQAGWAEPHFLVRQGVLPSTIVMLYAARDEEEAKVLLDLLRRSYEYATASAVIDSHHPTTPVTSGS